MTKEYDTFDAFEAAHKILESSGDNFVIEEFEGLTPESAADAADMINDALDNDLSDALEIRIFTEKKSGAFIARAMLAYGGPSLYAELESERETLTLTYENWGEVLKVKYPLHCDENEFIELADSLTEAATAEIE